MLKKSVTHLFIVSVAAVILTACGSSRSTGSTGSYKPAELSWPSQSETAAMAPQSQALLSAAHEWLGVPYRYGGNDRKGIDCSGLVLQVYKDALGIKLPRNSREQHDYCTAIAKGSLMPGDLIFFATGKDKKRVSHVGIFIGDNLMIHASSSKGVILSDINSQYYSRTYAGSGIVDQYHAMLGTPSRNPRKGIKPQKPDRPHQSQEGPVIHISQSESLAGSGYTLTPVEQLPAKADTITQQTSVPATTTAATTTTTAASATTTATSSTTTSTTATATPVKVATVSADPQPEPTPEEARAAVLKAIKEKDL